MAQWAAVVIQTSASWGGEEVWLVKLSGMEHSTATSCSTPTPPAGVRVVHQITTNARSASIEIKGSVESHQAVKEA